MFLIQIYKINAKFQTNCLKAFRKYFIMLLNHIKWLNVHCASRYHFRHVRAGPAINSPPSFSSKASAIFLSSTEIEKEYFLLHIPADEVTVPSQLSVKGLSSPLVSLVLFPCKKYTFAINRAVLRNNLDVCFGQSMSITQVLRGVRANGWKKNHYLKSKFLPRI